MLSCCMILKKKTNVGSCYVQLQSENWDLLNDFLSREA